MWSVSRGLKARSLLRGLLLLSALVLLPAASAAPFPADSDDGASPSQGPSPPGTDRDLPAPLMDGGAAPADDEADEGAGERSGVASDEAAGDDRPQDGLLSPPLASDGDASSDDDADTLHTPDADETDPSVDPGTTAGPLQDVIPVPPGLPRPTPVEDLFRDAALVGPPAAPDEGDAQADAQAAPAATATAPRDASVWPTAAAGLTLAALAGVAAWRLALPALAAAKAVRLGYRIERTELLDHPVRRKMIDHLEAHPGATAADLAAVAGVTYARATYHIAMLAREQAIRVQKVDHKKRYFPFASPKADLERLRLADLARPQTLSGRMLEFLRRAPGLTVSRLSRALGVSPGHAHYHLSRLIQNGLLEAHRRGREVRYYLTDASRTVHPPQQAEPVSA